MPWLRAASWSSSSEMPSTPVSGGAFTRGTLVQDLAQLLVLQDLALHPLQGIVDRLRVTAQLLRHLLVGGAFEVELERVGLQLRKAGAEREDEALQLLGRDHANRRIVDARSGEGVAEGYVGVGVLPGRRVREGDVGVQRRVLEPRRRLDRRDDLPRHAELGEATERRLLVVAEIADRLVKADQPFLDQVFGVATGEEVRARLQAHEAVVAADQRIERLAVAVSRADDELKIRELALLSLN